MHYAEEATSTPLRTRGGPYMHTDSLVRFAEANKPTNRRMLDLCCGTGIVLQAFARAGWEVTGLDSSPELVIAAQRRVPRSSCRLGYDYQTLEVESDYFDLIVAFDDFADSFEGTNDLLGALFAARQSLAIGGHLVFQIASSAQWATYDALLRLGKHAGFTAVWPASPINPEEPLCAPHGGARHLIVARRDL